jgi:hypothetical protein
VGVVAYDVIICAPLAIERWIAAIRGKTSGEERVKGLSPLPRPVSSSEEGI